MVNVSNSYLCVNLILSAFMPPHAKKEKEKKNKSWMYTHTYNMQSNYHTPAIYISIHNISIVLCGVWCTHAAEVTDLILPTEAIRLHTWQYDELQCLQEKSIACCHCWAYDYMHKHMHIEHSVVCGLWHSVGVCGTETVLFKACF